MSVFQGLMFKVYICFIIVGFVLLWFSLSFCALLNSRKKTRELSPEYEWNPVRKCCLPSSKVVFHPRGNSSNTGSPSQIMVETEFLVRRLCPIQEEIVITQIALVKSFRICNTGTLLSPSPIISSCWVSCVEYHPICRTTSLVPLSKIGKRLKILRPTLTAFIPASISPGSVSDVQLPFLRSCCSISFRLHIKAR